MPNIAHSSLSAEEINKHERTEKKRKEKKKAKVKENRYHW